MEQNNDIENFPKHGTRKFIRALILAISLIGTIIFISILPNLWWEITWTDLIDIVTNKTPTIDLTNKLSKLTELLGITSNNLRSWAIERMAISIAVGIGIFIFIYIITLPLKEKDKD